MSYYDSDNNITWGPIKEDPTSRPYYLKNYQGDLSSFDISDTYALVKAKYPSLGPVHHIEDIVINKVPEPYHDLFFIRNRVVVGLYTHTIVALLERENTTFSSHLTHFQQPMANRNR